MKRVWEGAAAILEENDRDWIQQLPKDLDSSTTKCNGREHLKALIDKRPDNSDIGQFIGVSKVFLDVLTHPALLDCLAVDEYVAGIYNFLSGGNGTRAVSFFRRLCKLLTISQANDAVQVSQKVLAGTIVGISAALYELLRRDSRARLNSDIEDLAVSLKKAAATLTSESHSVGRYLADIQAMVSRAQGLIADDEPTEAEQHNRTVSFTYPREQVTPRDRHDNDKKDISDVKIFPTRDEIMSDAKEFLPSTDPDQPHFLTGQVERYLDTNFRLLRHDVFGELKKAIAGLMHAATRDPNVLEQRKLSLGDVRIYSYSKAHVENWSFSSRQGLEAHISFVQPQIDQRLSAHQMQSWWEDCKRLGEGCLLSYIWTDGSVLQHSFLSVTQRSTDPKKGYGLSNHAEVATIVAKPLAQDNRSLRDLLKSTCDQRHGVLIEFPKVIPATFVPILENLQSMQRLSLLKFQQYILPEPHDGPPGRKVYQNIASPLYARSAGFSFPLSPILKKKGERLSITAESSCDDTVLIQDIVSKTELDEGQVKALIAALTREFAFIQGPPGTGKSYLGLQVMKILLEIRQKVKLGPVIVV